MMNENNEQQDTETTQNPVTTKQKILKTIYIFHSLPHWKKICHCIDLKVACYAVCVLYVLFIGEAFSGKTTVKRFNQCYTLGPLMHGLGYVSIGLIILTFFACLFFLYGIAMESPIPTLCFMYLTTLLILFNTVTNALLLFIETKYKCYAPFLFGGATYFGAILLIFCLVVVNSFYRHIIAK
ncbi:uncharacterized protein LOC113496477 [Trichoplusia ni]|uniref:Uncharacterized protein LOC113496477 n=1 Tax=Trichoplusia ni TaxID=7111 RepID=A0A7E5VT47_TRINI|nr:uncharacterized protein LOC113496477 [Trichoplusia ni]